MYYTVIGNNNYCWYVTVNMLGDRAVYINGDHPLEMRTVRNYAIPTITLILL